MTRGATEAREAGRLPFGRRGTAGPDVGSLEFGRLTWLGLALSLLGWVLLIAVAATAEALLRVGRSAVFHDDLVAISKCLIASGFALAAIGTLQAGFGALDRFFGAVLLRSGARAEPAGRVEPVGPQPYDPEPPRRPYRTLPDGSVEVDTILGTRRFDTMGEARDFI